MNTLRMNCHPPIMRQIFLGPHLLMTNWLYSVLVTNFCLLWTVVCGLMTFPAFGYRPWTIDYRPINLNTLRTCIGCSYELFGTGRFESLNDRFRVLRLCSVTEPQRPASGTLVHFFIFLCGTLCILCGALCNSIFSNPSLSAFSASSLRSLRPCIVLRLTTYDLRLK
jgi:hypothetical protein